MRKTIAALLWLGLPALAGAQAWQSALIGGSGEPGAWTYQGERGPAQWARLGAANAACGNGQRQSPVPLDSRVAAQLSCLPLQFRYRSSALFVKHDANTLRLGYDRGSYLVVDGLSYELGEIRFHVPAEHMIDGQVAAAEVQLIHGNNRGDIAIVAVPVVVGQRSNQTLRRILEHAPVTPGEAFYGRNVGINPMFLLPGRKDYFAYEGSLTRPPCTEGVHWYVLATPLEVDTADYQRLAALTTGNVRPLQPVAGRPVTRASCSEP